MHTNETRTPATVFEFVWQALICYKDIAYSLTINPKTGNIDFKPSRKIVFNITDKLLI